MKWLAIIFLSVGSAAILAQDKTLPYYEIPHPSESFTAGAVASHMIDGLGFVFSTQRFDTYMKRLTASQRAKLLQEAIAEEGEEPKTQEAAA